MAHQVVLQWDAPAAGGDPRTNYNVYRIDTATGTKTLVGSPTAETFTDTTVVSGGSYQYEVTAVGPGGESAPTNEVSATITFSAPNAPTNLVVVSFA